MNQRLYQIIFNDTRGQLMVVAETATGNGQSATGRRSAKRPVAPYRASLRALSCSLFAALGFAVCLPPAAHAQIVAYRGAPRNQQPTILKAGNGVPLINIQTPSAAGVSRNSYSQFDVQSTGAILNNSRRDTQTQLGGWVSGNPWLATGSARVVLNQVHSANPSLLQGYVEVAGSSAQVVIANPAGVTCAGCGFINANRITLSTGTPIVNAGNLDGYRVEGGTLRVEGAGLDASRVTQTDLIARAVEINAGLWANTLSVTTGANQVDADHHQTAPIASNGAAPAFALDVAHLGGMYAGKITLVGTEAGVGVRNAGAIGASAGEVSITADGRLHNSGRITSATRTQIDTDGGIDNSGTVYALGDAILATRGNIDNSGTIAAQRHATLSATGSDSRINGSASSLLAAGLASDSSLVGSSRLEISASEQIAWHGQAIASGDQSMRATALDLSDSQVRADNLTLTATNGNLDARRSVLSAAGTLSAAAAQNLLHDNAHSDAKQLQLSARDFSNTNGELIQTGGGQTVINASGSFDNRGGTLTVSGALDLHSGALANDGGLIQADGELSVDTRGQRLSNTNSGSAAGIFGQSAVNLVTGDLDNNGGFIGAKGTLAATSSGAIDNRGGLISSADTLQLLDPNASPTSNAASKTLTITNTGGTLIADQRLIVDSDSLSGDGKVFSQGDLAVKLLADFTHTGQFSAIGSASLETAGDLTNRAALQAGKHLDVKAAKLDNETPGEIVATTLQLTTSQRLTNRGLIDGDETLIDSTTINNLGAGRIYGDHLAIAATALHNDAENGSAPLIAARERLDIAAATISNREHAQLFSAGDLVIGGTLNASHYATGLATRIDNASASIEALGNLAISAGQISNTNEHFSTKLVATGSELIDQYVLSGRSTRYSPSDVTLQWDHAPGTYFHPPQGNGMGFMSQQGFFSDNSNNYIYLNTPEGSGRNFWLYSVTRSTTESQVLTTDPGKIIAGGNLQLTADSVFNHNSQIVAGGSLTGAISQLNNIASAGERTVSDSGTAWFIFRDGDHHDSDRNSYAYHPAPVVTGFLLPSLRYDSHASASESGTKVAPLVIDSVNLTTGATTLHAGGAATLIHTITPNLAEPDNSLFRINSSPSTHYLIETDPKFSSYRQWLSSDYLLNALAIDPAITQKRLGDAAKQTLLGDGFYEQRLISEQIAQLTGRRFLDGYASDEAQYQALMDAGLTYARSWQLIPGVALSAEQMAQLTSDIVWLIEKDIVLPNGQTSRALVPQVYVRVGDGDLTPGGALISANDIDLQLSGDLTNSGAIAGRQIVVLSAENVANLGGHINGRDTLISVRNDLVNLGGSLQARDRLIASAGRNLTVESTTRTQTNDQGHRTNLDRVAGLYVTGSNGTLVAAAGNDLTLLAAAISNAEPTAAGTPDTANGTTLLFAGNNLTLGTVSENRSDASVRDRRNYRRTSQSSEVGTEIRSTGDLTLQAGNDLSARAANVTSDQGTLSVLAGNDLAITTGAARATVDEGHRYTKKGFLSSTTTTTRDTLDATTALASTLSGDTVALQSGRDIQIAGSNVSAAGALDVAAGRDIRVDSAQEAQKETHLKSVKQSGFSASLMGGISYGMSSMQQNTAGQSLTQVASTISGADISTSSGRNTTIIASNALADRDISVLAGRDVNILTAASTQNMQSQFKSDSASFGFGGGFSGRQTIYSKASASENINTKASAPATSLLSANNGNLMLRAGLDNQYKGTGSGNLTTQGADLLAGQAITLSGNTVDLQAVANESTSHSITKSKSFVIGTAPAGSIGSQITAISDHVDRVHTANNSRLKAASALKAGYDAYKLVTGQKTTSLIPGGLDPNAPAAPPVEAPTDIAGSGYAKVGIGVSVSLTSSRSESESRESRTAVRGTNLQARSIDITASEADLKMAAAKLQAETINLAAARHIELAAAANRAALESDNKSSSNGLGVTFAFGGQQSGLSFQISASQSKGLANGSETVWDNTRITATDTLTLRSDADTTLKGAQLSADHVRFNVGHNLLIETLQDSSRYTSQQSSSGFSLSFCFWFCAGTPVMGSVGSSSQSFQHNYLSAVGQSGIAAGEGGFDINVKGNTDLIGAAITGSSAADKNRLTTASLTSRDLDNVQNTQGHSSSFSIAYGSSAGATLAGNATANLLANLQGNAAQPKNGSESTTTLSLISPAQITITGSGDAAQDARRQETVALLTSRDPKTANASLKNTLTLQQAQALQDETRKAQENMEAAKLVGAVLANVVGDVALNRNSELQLQENARAKAAGESPMTIIAWGEGSAQKLALHGLVGLIEAKIGGGSAAAGALAGMGQEALTPILSAYLEEKGFIRGNDDYKALMQFGATLVGTAIGTMASGNVQGASTGANAAFVGVTNNTVYHYKGKIIAYDKNGNDKIIELSDQDLSKLAAQNPEFFLQLVAGIGKQEAPILVVDTSSDLMTKSSILDLKNSNDNSQIARESDMGYKNLTDQATRIYVQTGMDTTPSDAEQNATALSKILGQPVGYINNGTEGLPGDVGEYLPDSISKREVLNEFTYRTLDGKGPTLIVLYSAGNEDARKALQVGALYGHQYDNLSFLSIASPVSDSTLKTAFGQGGAQYPGQVNDWKDPITYSKTAGVVSIGSFLGGISYGAAQGCAAGGVSGPLGCTFFGVIGGAAGGVAGAIPAVAGLFGQKYYHPFEQYIAKPQTQTLLFDWLKANPPAATEQ